MLINVRDVLFIIKCIPDLFILLAGVDVVWRLTLKRSGDAKKSKIRIANKPALNNNSHAKQLT